MKKMCLPCLDLVLSIVPLRGWEGGRYCVIFLGEGVHTGPRSAPQQGILIGYYNSHKMSIYFFLTHKYHKWVQLFV